MSTEEKVVFVLAALAVIALLLLLTSKTGQIVVFNVHLALD